MCVLLLQEMNFTEKENPLYHVKQIEKGIDIVITSWQEKSTRLTNEQVDKGA